MAGDPETEWLINGLQFEANKPLISWVDLGQDYNLSAANFSIPWDALGAGYINF